MLLRHKNTIIIALALWVALCYFICSLYTPFVGDDLLMWYYGDYDMHKVCGLLRHAARYWLYGTGRLGDIFNPLVYNLIPHWLLYTINGIMHGALLLLIALWSSRNTAGRTLAMAVAIVALPWCSLWMEFATAINYVWAGAIVLSALWLIIYARPMQSRVATIAALLYAAMGGGMHEASGLPISAGLLVWLYFGIRQGSISKTTRNLAIAFMVGTLFVTASPGIWGRLGAPLSTGFVTPGIAHRIFVWNWPTMLLIAVCALRHKRVFSLIDSPFVIFAIAAVASLVFSTPSGVGLRVTWFGQLFAMIAIFMIMADKMPRPASATSRVITIIASIVIVSQTAVTAYWQKRLGSETRHVVEQYRASANGQVIADFTDDADLPWYVLRKVHGVPDADDSHYLNTLNTAYSGDTKPTVIIRASAPVSNSLPAGARTVWRHDPRLQIPPLTVIDTPEGMLIATPFTIAGDTLWSITPFDNDPGTD